MSQHLMFDFETMSLRMNTVLSEFGWCLYDPEQEGLIIDSGSMLLDWSEQIERRSLQFRHVSGSTLKWWLKQSDEARQKLTRDEKPSSLLDMLHRISAFPWQSIDGIWSHGANFDIAILQELYMEMGEKGPWHYRCTRDTRTLYWIAGMKEADLVRADVKHSAKDDAIAQAKSVQKACKIIMEHGSNFLRNL